MGLCHSVCCEYSCVCAVILPLRTGSLLLAIALGARFLTQALFRLNPVNSLAKAASGLYTDKTNHLGAAT